MAVLAAAIVLLSSGSSVTPTEQTTVLAAAAGVDAMELQGAVNATGASPQAYLIYEGLLDPDPPATHAPSSLPPSTSSSPAASTSGVYSSRVACIEGKESEGKNVANRRGSGAVGVLQYMPSTFAAHAAEMGHPEYSPWNPTQARAVAAHDLALGRRSQWTVGGC
jgi:hypothetical protein